MANLNLEEKIISLVLKSLDEDLIFHNISSSSYLVMKEILINTVDSLYYKSKNGKFHFSVFGDVEVPYVSFGNINTKHLFGIDELIIFTYYNLQKNNYNTVLDFGANIGLHSLIMSKCFSHVHSFEPDDFHYKILSNTIKDNKCSNVTLHKEAISSFDGHVEFTRVKGNTTGSHISGSKELVYGDIEKFDVPCLSLESIIKMYNPDFIKMDVEGQERNILTNTSIKYFENLDLMVEVGSIDNAVGIYEYFKDTDIKLFSQKNGWKQVRAISEMPTSHKEGSLFISKKEMKWK